MLGKGIFMASAGIFSGLVAAHKVSEEIAGLAVWLDPLANTMAAFGVCAICYWALRYRRRNPSRA
ncbi:MAG: hypothetical protein SFV21_11320 [Rhodospirillaceae bacterium]|nr:hypothetical protein [Rhodospirillaceae bacterium]